MLLPQHSDAPQPKPETSPALQDHRHPQPPRSVAAHALLAHDEPRHRRHHHLGQRELRRVHLLHTPIHHQALLEHCLKKKNQSQFFSFHHDFYEKPLARDARPSASTTAAKTGGWKHKPHPTFSQARDGNKDLRARIALAPTSAPKTPTPDQLAFLAMPMPNHQHADVRNHDLQTSNTDPSHRENDPGLRSQRREEDRRNCSPPTSQH